MESTSDYIGQIITVLKTETEPINPSTLAYKLGWNKDKINEVCRIFSVTSFIEVLRKINGVEIKKNEHGTAYVSYNENLNNNQKENSESTLKSVRQSLKVLTKVFTKKILQDIYLRLILRFLMKFGKAGLQF